MQIHQRSSIVQNVRGRTNADTLRESAYSKQNSLHNNFM